MNTRLYKEYRILRPFWAIALCLPLVPLMLLQKGQEQPFYCSVGYVVGCLLLGAASFGAEWNHHTMDLLLSQPLSRQRMWRDKIRMLALALGSLGLVYLLSLFVQINPDEARPLLQGIGILYGLIWLVLPIAWALGAGPYYALHVGNSLIAFVCSLSAPLWWILIMGLLFPSDSFTGQAGFAQACCVYAMPLIFFAVASYRSARFRFHHLETAGFTSPAIRPIEWLSASVKSPAVVASADTGGALGKLIRKELRLHEVSFLIAGCAVSAGALIMACCLVYAAFAAERFDHSLPSGLVEVVAVLTALGIPILSGAVAVAEERQMGLLEWHLTLPPSRFRQWLVKILTAYGCSIVLGILTPTALVLASEWLSANSLDRHLRMNIYEYLGYCSISLLLTTVCLVASSLSHTSLKAVLLSLGTFVLGGVTIGIMILCGADNYFFTSPILWLSVWSLKYWALGIAGTAAVLMMVGLSYVNYRRLDTRLSPVIQTVLVSLALVFFAFTPRIIEVFKTTDHQSWNGLKGRALLAHLGHEDPQRVVAELGVQLNNPANAVAVMRALYIYRTPEALPLMVAELTNSNPGVQFWATTGLSSRWNDLQKQPSLFDRARVTLYQNLLNTNAVYFTATALGRVDTATIIDALNRKSADSTTALMPGAPNNLGNMIREKFVPLLVELYNESESDSQKREAAIGFGNIGSVLRSESDYRKREGVIDILGKLGPGARQAIPMLLKAAQSDPSPRLRNRAIEVLKKIDPEAVRSHNLEATTNTPAQK